MRHVARRTKTTNNSKKVAPRRIIKLFRIRFIKGARRRSLRHRREYKTPLSLIKRPATIVLITKGQPCSISSVSSRRRFGRRNGNNTSSKRRIRLIVRRRRPSRRQLPTTGSPWLSITSNSKCSCANIHRRPFVTRPFRRRRPAYRLNQRRIRRCPNLRPPKMARSSAARY